MRGAAAAVDQAVDQVRGAAVDDDDVIQARGVRQRVVEREAQQTRR